MPSKESFVPRSQWPFDEVLSDEYTRTLETTQVYVTNVEPRYTNQLLKFTQKYLPALQHLEHCKRIKRSKLPDSNELVLTSILCACDNMDISTLKDLATKHDITLDPRPIGVPRYAPKNKKQFEEWNPVWPVTYREDPRQDPKWTQLDLDTVETHMRQLMTPTLETIDNEVGNNNSSNRNSNDAGDSLKVYARIVDPKTNTILAEAKDTRHLGHPLHHAVMNCVDLISSKERHNKQQQEQQQQQQQQQDEGHKRKHDDDDDDDSPVSYLCSGYDAYVTHEPCAMCAMALVHSRISRVFYSIPTETGCLGTIYKIHSHSSLNHHYKAFKNVLLNDPLRTPYLEFPDPLDA